MGLVIRGWRGDNGDTRGGTLKQLSDAASGVGITKLPQKGWIVGSLSPVSCITTTLLLFYGCKGHIDPNIRKIRIL